MRVDGSCFWQPRLERDRSFDLPALAHAGNDLGDQQFSAIRIDARIEVDAIGVHARAGVRATVNVDAAGNAKSGSRAVGGEIEMSDALGRVGIAEDRVEQTHIQIADGFALPAGMREIVKDTGNIERAVWPVICGSAAVGRELKTVQGGAIALEVEVELQLAVHGRSLFSRQFAGENEVGGGGMDAIALGRAESSRPVDHLKGYVGGFEVERVIAILSVESGGAIVQIESSMLNRDLAGAKVEEGVECGFAGFLRPARTRLVGRAVAINNEVQLRPHNFEIAQRNMRSEKAKDADLDAEAVDRCVGRFVGILSAMNDDAVCFRFEMEKAPMKRPDLRASAGGVFNLRDEAFAN